MAYATRADLRAACRKDSLAKLTVDPNATEVIGTGDGAETTFSTPFEAVTTAKVYADGVAVASGWSLSRATGTDNRDRIAFAIAPAAGVVISASADAAAIHADDLDAVLESVSAEMDSYLHALLPVTDATLLASLKGKAVILARMRLRGRRNLDVVDPIEMEWKATMRWLELVAEGKIPISQGAPDAAPDGSDGDYAYGSFAPVFSTDEGMP